MFGFGDGNGYMSDHSMSVNAHNAYADGQMPLSKWTKAAMLDSIGGLMGSDVFDSYNWNKLNVKTLRDYFLVFSGWHHTSKHYNDTDFYSVDEDAIEDFNQQVFDDLLKKQKMQKKPNAIYTLKKGRVKYGEWSGTRNHPKLVESEEYAIILYENGVAKTAYLSEKTKRMGGKHIQLVETYAKAPKGKAHVFGKIKETIPKKYRDFV